MKTYKTWEMIRELTENPDKQFISNKGANDEEIAYVSTGGYAIIFETTNEKLENGNPQISVISRIRAWEEAKKPLTFMEMLEKVEENPYCKVSVEHKEILRKHITGESLKDLLDKLERRFTNAVMAIMLLEGKFYIED